ncbi:MAG: ABC transporter substrate-binding protein [Deltaproteobacteria bacterium]|nr:ABC transporter substrate-binding protein [Deltaproteobacteria bacterium]
MKIRILAITCLAVLLCGTVWASEPIKIGLLSDLSGATSSVGRPYADGIKACAEYLNEEGGINGRPIVLDQVDYAYNVQQALAAYKRMKSQGIVALQGWGTGDTEALVKFVAKDEMPTFSASYSAHLTDPNTAPYNFFCAADYSTQARAALKFVRENWKEERAPKLALIYPDAPYGLAPLAAAEAYARELGFEIVGKEIVDLKAMEATTQLLRLQKVAPDYAWVGGTTPSTAVVLKDAQKLKMNVIFITNIWGSDENIFDLAGTAANGHISIQAAKVYGQPCEGMVVIEKLTKGVPQMTHFIRGFVSMLTMAEGLKRAEAAGQLNGPGIKAALESMRDFDPMGLAAPISFYPDDHRPNLAVSLYELRDDKLNFLGEQTLERKKEWLGK